MNLIKFLFLLLTPFSVLSFTELGKFESNNEDIKPFNYILSETRSINSVTIGLISNPKTVIPYTNKESLYNSELLHDSLYKKDLSTGLIYKPSLAIQTRFDNQKNWVEFDLNEDVRFSNNTKIRAEDIVFSYKFYLKNGNDEIKKILSQIDFAKALSEKTVRFDLKKSGMEIILTLSTIPILQKSSWENKDTENFKDVNFSGPYILKNDDLKKAELEKNGYYFANSSTNIGYYNYGYININSYENISSLTNAFNGKKIDISINEIKPSFGIKENIKLNDTITSGIFLNPNKQIFKDKNMRESFLKFFNYIYKVQNSSIYHNDIYSGKNLSLFSDEIKSFYNIKQINKSVFNFKEAFDNSTELNRKIQLNDSFNVLMNKDFKGKIIINAIIKKNDKLEETAKILSNNLKPLNIILNINQYDEITFNIKKESKDYDIIFDSVNLNPLDVNDFYIFKNYIPDELFSKLSISKTFEDYLKIVRMIDKVVMFEYIYFPIYKENYKTIISQKRFDCPKNLNEFKFYLCRF